MSDYTINLKYIMQQKGIKQQELADKIGCSRQEISDWSTGRRTPVLGRIHMLADALEVPVSLLVANPDELEALERCYKIIKRPELVEIMDLVADLPADELATVISILKLVNR